MSSVNPSNNLNLPFNNLNNQAGPANEPTDVVNDMFELWLLSQGYLGNDLSSNVLIGQAVARCISDLANKIGAENPPAGSPDAILYKYLTTSFGTPPTTLATLANSIMSAQAQGNVDSADITTLITSLTQPISGQETPAQFFWNSVTASNNSWFQQVGASGSSGTPYYSWPLDQAQTDMFETCLQNAFNTMNGYLNVLNNDNPTPAEQIQALQGYAAAFQQVASELNTYLPSSPITQTMNDLLNTLYPVSGSSPTSAAALLKEFANPSYKPTTADVNALLAILQPQNSYGFAEILSDFIHSVMDNSENIFNNGPFPPSSGK